MLRALTAVLVTSLLLGICECFHVRFAGMLPRTSTFSRVSPTNAASVRSATNPGVTKTNVDLVADRTRTCLDFDVILGELQRSCKTVLGAELCAGSTSCDAASANEKYAMVKQISPELEHIPLRTRMDAQKLLNVITNNTAQPEREDIASFSFDIDTIVALHSYLSSHNDTLPGFQQFIPQLALPANVTDTFDSAFETDLKLNVAKYPDLGNLSKQIETKKESIVKNLQALVQSSDMRDKLADSGYMELNGRFCIMLKNSFRKNAGIAHGASNTGKTLHVEPMAVIEPTNELKQLQSLFREEENRVLLAMCQCIAAHLLEVEAAVRAVAQVDVFAAKAKLGHKLGGVIPEVSNEGVIRCVDAKHPVLLLRQLQNTTNTENTDYVTDRDNPDTGGVVGNSFELTGAAPALVISGPNAGGKTIVLKSAGLFALMVQHGIPLPARSGARVDLFPEVMADIGDMQSVSGDISTFSGHLLVCREILHRAQARAACRHVEVQTQASAEEDFQGSEEGETLDSAKDAVVAGSANDGQCLVLLDEVGTGTDPEQGAALAQSVLERLVQLGARVMATTHYQRIKELAVLDPRFRIAAMEFVNNLPTYRMRAGSVGESHALEAARRLGLPENVLLRADSLLDGESRKLVGLQRRLAEEVDTMRAEQVEYRLKCLSLEQKEKEVEDAKMLLVEEIERVRRGKIEQHLKELRSKEREVDFLLGQARETIAKQLKDATHAKKAPSLTDITSDAHIAEIQSAMKARRVEVEKQVIAALPAAEKHEPLKAGEVVELGTRLVVLDPNSGFLGRETFASRRNNGGGRVCVRLAGVEMKIERHLLGIPTFLKIAGSKDADVSKMTPQERRFHEQLLEIGDVGDVPDYSRVSKGPLPRTAENTIDIRDVCATISAAREQITAYVRRNVKPSKKNAEKKKTVLYVQHGVNCAYKGKLRTWLLTLESVKKAVAPPLSAGGEAFTMIEILC